MATADPPPPRRSDADEANNLAARVYDGGPPRVDGSDGDGGDGSARAYNLAARVYDGGPPRVDGSDGDGGDGSARAYNLAARVYDGGPPRVDGSDGANGSARAYNLAARVYGSNGADGAAAAVVAPFGTEVVAPPARSAAALAPPAAGGPATAAVEQPKVRLAIRTFESMQVPAFRWFFLAMLGQFSAMNMQMFIRGYLVFQLTGSFAALGVMSLANAIPMFIFSLPGGVLADRASRKWVLQAGQLGNAAIAASICTLLFLDMLRFEHLLASAFVQGVVWSLMMPARQAMIPEIVGERRLMNAVALSMAGMNVTRLVAPGVGGLMVAWLGGADWVYVLMTASFLFAIVTLLPVPAKPAAAVDRPLAAAGASVRGGGGGFGGGGGGGGARGMRDIADGIRYIARNPTVFAVLAANFVIVLFSVPYMMMMPGFVADILHGGPDQLGLLMTITGVGALAGSLVIAAMPSRNRGKILLISSLVLGIALIAFSLSRSMWLTAGIMIVIGLGQTGRMSLSNVLLQVYVEDAYRGRVMSVYMMEFGVVSFGVFFVGILSSIVGVDWAIGATAVALTAVSLGALLFYPRLRDLQ